jgi:thiamine-phosphate pyrophosphorylase
VRLPVTDLYAVLSSAHSAGRGNVRTAELLLQAGVRIIQYREKEFPFDRQLAECAEIARLSGLHNACFIVNDSLELALAAGAGGLHLGQSDLPPAVARVRLGRDKIIGYSVTCPAEVDRALAMSDIDYLGVGPVYATATKRDATRPGGLELIDYALRLSPVPVVAIGGIGRHNAAELARRGVPTLAMVTELVGAPDIAERVRELRAVMWGDSPA